MKEVAVNYVDANTGKRISSMLLKDIPVETNSLTYDQIADGCPKGWVTVDKEDVKIVDGVAKVLVTEDTTPTVKEVAVNYVNANTGKRISSMLLKDIPVETNSLTYDQIADGCPKGWVTVDKEDVKIVDGVAKVLVTEDTTPTVKEVAVNYVNANTGKKIESVMLKDIPVYPEALTYEEYVASCPKGWVPADKKDVKIVDGTAKVLVTEDTTPTVKEVTVNYVNANTGKRVGGMKLKDVPVDAKTVALKDVIGEIPEGWVLDKSETKADKEIVDGAVKVLVTEDTTPTTKEVTVNYVNANTGKRVGGMKLKDVPVDAKTVALKDVIGEIPEGWVLDKSETKADKEIVDGAVKVLVTEDTTPTTKEVTVNYVNANTGKRVGGMKLKDVPVDAKTVALKDVIGEIPEGWVLDKSETKADKEIVDGAVKVLVTEDTTPTVKEVTVNYVNANTGKRVGGMKLKDVPVDAKTVALKDVIGEIPEGWVLDKSETKADKEIVDGAVKVLVTEDTTPTTKEVTVNYVNANTGKRVGGMKLKDVPVDAKTVALKDVIGEIPEGWVLDKSETKADKEIVDGAVKVLVTEDTTPTTKEVTVNYVNANTGKRVGGMKLKDVPVDAKTVALKDVIGEIPEGWVLDKSETKADKEIVDGAVKVLVTEDTTPTTKEVTVNYVNANTGKRVGGMKLKDVPVDAKTVALKDVIGEIPEGWVLDKSETKADKEIVDGAVKVLVTEDTTPTVKEVAVNYVNANTGKRISSMLLKDIPVETNSLTYDQIADGCPKGWVTVDKEDVEIVDGAAKVLVTEDTTPTTKEVAVNYVNANTGKKIESVMLKDIPVDAEALTYEEYVASCPKGWVPADKKDVKIVDGAAKVLVTEDTTPTVKEVAVNYVNANTGKKIKSVMLKDIPVDREALTYEKYVASCPKGWVPADKKDVKIVDGAAKVLVTEDTTPTAKEVTVNYVNANTGKRVGSMKLKDVPVDAKTVALKDVIDEIPKGWMLDKSETKADKEIVDGAVKVLVTEDTTPTIKK